jgi:polyphosphate kinase
VRSVVGDLLEHSRLFYFHQAGQPRLYAGSADVMVRSFDRRIEALFLIVNPQLKREAIGILMLNLLDNQNSYVMREDGAYIRRQPQPDEVIVNVHKDFYRRDEERLTNATPDGMLGLLTAAKAAEADALAAAQEPVETCGADEETLVEEPETVTVEYIVAAEAEEKAEANRTNA